MTPSCRDDGTETADIRLTAGIATWPVPVIAIPCFCFLLGLSVQPALIKKEKEGQGAAFRCGGPSWSFPCSCGFAQLRREGTRMGVLAKTMAKNFDGNETWEFCFSDGRRPSSWDGSGSLSTR
jgi:hypothetical protein